MCAREQSDKGWSKVVVVGDGGVGKTSLLLTFQTGAFPRDDIPTVTDKFSCNAYIAEKLHEVVFMDTVSLPVAATIR